MRSAAMLIALGTGYCGALGQAAELGAGSPTVLAAAEGRALDHPAGAANGAPAAPDAAVDSAAEAAAPVAADGIAPAVLACRRLFADRAAAAACYRELLRTPNLASRAEAAWALGDVRGAAAAFRAAIAAAPADPRNHTRFADLRAAVHQAADAEAGYLQALQADPAYAGAKLGLARLALGRFDRRAEELASEVLRAEPANIHAKLLLGELALEVGDLDRAERAFTPGLTHAVPEARLEAMALAAAHDHLRGVAPSPWEARALAIHPGYGALFEKIAHFYVITRRYRQAVAQLERAVAVAPELWSAHATLGLNLLRLNRFAAARVALATAHRGFPYNPVVVNTLRLLDSVSAWPEQGGDGLILRTAPEEAEALGGTVRGLVADAVAVIGKRYGYAPKGPVVVELYPRHADFAVRTSGLPGIGILGATFGDVVVMDSPSARASEEGFDWASALWHEVAHVITLGATDNRVSRWFSEGISVLEEWQTGPSRFQVPGPAPGPAVPARVVKAFRAQRLLPVAELDEGFIRPTYPGQVAVSYAQAGLLCQHIAIAHGGAALTAMLAGYGRGLSTADALRAALGTEPEALDAEFAAALERRLAGIDPDLFDARMEEASKAAKAEDWPAARAAAQHAAAAHPHRVDAASPYPLLAEAEERLGNRQSAIAALTVYWQAGGRSTSILERLAGWQEAAGRDDAALAVRRALALTAPLTPAHRAELGDRLFAAGRHQEALREYLAHHALGPRDAASAHYRLARTYHALGQPEPARRQVLAALEIAPRYRPALALLLKLGD